MTANKTLEEILEDNWTQDPMGGTMTLEEALAWIETNYLPREAVARAIKSAVYLKPVVVSRLLLALKLDDKEGNNG